MPHSLVELPSTLIWLGTAGEVSTRRTPRWVKVPVRVVVTPPTRVRVWHDGSVQPSTCVKHTVWLPGVSFSQVRPQESAIWPSTRTWVGSGGDDVTRSKAVPTGSLQAPRPWVTA